MKMLRFEVCGQYITRIDEEVPVAKCMNVFKAHFDFLTEEWTGTKTAIFVQGNYSKSQVLDEKGECLVPWEFFDTEEKTRGYVSVYCGDLMTANESKVMIAKTGYRESDASVPPTPDVYQQILESMDGKLDKAGHVPDKYLGTDSEGNVVEKEGPSGDGSGTADYNSLENKPHINGVELQGEKTLEELGIQKKGNYASKEEIPTSLPASDVYDWAKEPEKPLYTADEVGAEEKGTIDKHNASKETHQDIREILIRLEEKVKAIANSDDESLDTLAEIVAYIKSNKSLIDAITTEKVSTSDIVNDLITNVETKVLSAAQGVELKRQIDEVVKSIPKKLPNPHKLTFTGAVKAEYDGSGAVTVEIPDSSEGINAKLDKNQGAENAGKALIIGDDGNVIPGEVQSGDGIAIVNTMSGDSSLVIPDSAERPIKDLKIFGNSEQTQDPPPSPDHPQEIKSVGKWNEAKQKYEVDVTLSGAQLFKASEHSKGFYTPKDGKVSIVTTQGYSWKMNFSKWYGKKVVLSIVTTVNTRYRLYATDKEDNILYKYEDSSANTNNNYHVFEIPKNMNKLYISVLEINSEEQAEIMMNLGEVPFEYEPYKDPQTIQIELDQPIRSIGANKDELTKDGCVRRIKNIVFDGSVDEKWLLGNDPKNITTNRFIIRMKTINTFYKIFTMCDRLKYKHMNDVDVIGQSTHGQNFYATLPKELTPDLENFKTWLSQNPLIVDYVLDEPVTEPLPESVQQQLQTLKTYYPTTVITVDGGEVYGGVEVTYTADTKNYIDNKIKQEKSIPTAIPEIS